MISTPWASGEGRSSSHNPPFSIEVGRRDSPPFEKLYRTSAWGQTACSTWNVGTLESWVKKGKGNP